jgi:hypothetical protein
MDGVSIGGEGVYMVSGARLTAAMSAYDEATSLLSKNESSRRECYPTQYLSPLVGDPSAMAIGSSGSESQMKMLSKERAYKQVISWTGPNGQHGLQVGKRVVRWWQPSEDGRKL